MTDTVVAEGQVRLRDGKKWKNRWVVLRKPSPVADCLSLLVYKDKSEKVKTQRERSHVTLGDICGLEAWLGYEGVSYALAILCITQTVVMGFDSKDSLLAWDTRIRYSLGEVHRFSVNVQPGTKLECGPATLHLCNNLLVIAKDLPPVIIGQWKLSDLRRYGAVPNGFVFEGGTRCGYWAGVFFVACADGEQISFLFDCIVRGISPTRGPFGLRPPLPDPGQSPSSAEERINQEASALEKRLSMLSTCSRQSSTASTSSYSTSLAGDDRSISSSSSETSQSDSSLSSRLALWPEPARQSAPAEPSSSSSSSSSGATATKGASASAEERLYAAVMGGVRPTSKPPRPRGLQETGRQGSADSGIATGSHSSYSGSFSSYTGSLDIGQTETEEFGSLVSLPFSPGTNPSLGTNSSLSTSVSSSTSANPNLSPYNPNLAPWTGGPTREQAQCTCPPRAPGSEYQTPGFAWQHYDTPRSLLSPTSTLKEVAGSSPSAPQDTGAVGWGAQGSDEPPADTAVTPKRTLPPRLDLSDVEGMAPPGGLGAEGGSSTQQAARAPPPVCAVCGGVQATPFSTAGVFHMPALPGMQKTEADPKGGYERMAFSSDASRRSDFVPGEHGDSVSMAMERSGESANYVNIPVSPTSKRQLHYMELDLQEIGGQELSHSVRGGDSSTKYAHIDITATETAQRVGAQHAQGREERLQELEQRRKGAFS
ncbi:protein Dok-7 [Chanos chanos]|uniref:Protein Dok-7 n=1 Tax=Chanos chanos TaxID=29144 RepID=A0A6J2WDS8_CHACN|nr:protein Dok-7 [Chanos chanos]